MKYDLRQLHRIPRSLALAVAIALALIASGTMRQAAAQRYSAGPKLSKFAQQGSNAAANTMFSSGRDLIDDAQWAKAEAQFAQYLSAYPQEKNLDAAMYWMAYSQYKLRKFDQSKQTIDKLLKAYDKTAWKDDAELLLAQLPGAVTVKVDPVTVTADPVVATPAPAPPIAVTIGPVVATPARVAVAVQDPIEVQVRAQDIQERVAEAKARAQERVRESQERMQERLAEAQAKMKDKTAFKYNNFDFDFDFDF